MKILNKEIHNIFVSQLPAWLLQFVPDIILIPHHNLTTLSMKGKRTDPSSMRPNNSQWTYTSTAQPQQNTNPSWIELLEWSWPTSSRYMEPAQSLPQSGHCHACQQYQIMLLPTQSPPGCDGYLLVCNWQTPLPPMWTHIWIWFQPYQLGANPMFCGMAGHCAVHWLENKHNHHLDKLKWEVSLWICKNNNSHGH